MILKDLVFGKTNSCVVNFGELVFEFSILYNYMFLPNVSLWPFKSIKFKITHAIITVGRFLHIYNTFLFKFMINHIHIINKNE